MQIRNTSDVLLHRYDNSVASGGEFDFPMADLANGTYWLYVTIEGSLRKKAIVSYTTDGVEEQGITLIMGDTDGSNSVNIADALYTYSKIGASSTDADWRTPDSNGRYAAVADFYRDGEITLDDYDIAWANIGQSGD